LTGDINLNGVPYEVGDVVLFINHIINPAGFPFNAIQREASDINADGIPETIADLVLLINIVNGSVPPPKIDPSTGNVIITLSKLGDSHAVSSSGDVDLGAVLVKISHDSESDVSVRSTGDFTIAYHESDNVVTVLAYLPEGGGVPAGRSNLFKLENLGEEYEIVEISASDSRGGLITAVSHSIAVLPEKFELSQNYPNPFNATTMISFALPEPQQTTLEIFNISGQKIGTLVDGNLEAGIYNINWNGSGDDGKTVASGVYLYKLHTDSKTISRKMTLLK